MTLTPDGPTRLLTGMTAHILRADALSLPLRDESVDLIVTSPPYFALRSYTDDGTHYAGQIGAEPTPAAFVDALLTATVEMVRVLKPSGSLWINLGDKYAGQGRSGSATPRQKADQRPISTVESVGSPGFSSDQTPAASIRSAQFGQYPSQPSPNSENISPHSRHATIAMPGSVGPTADMKQGARDGNRRSRPAPVDGVRGKSLIGIPWRYVLRCIDELGLILRAEVIWSKPNGLPESVTDRVRRSHETWFHFTRSPRYYSAVDEIREPYTESRALSRRVKHPGIGKRDQRAAWSEENALGKLPGSVWTIATQPLKVPAELGIDHFAAFPMEWPRRLIRGWSPAGGVVLDPFGGTGTTALMATVLGRRGISVDMSADYCRLARWRTTDPGQVDKATNPKPQKARKPMPKPADDLERIRRRHSDIPQDPLPLEMPTQPAPVHHDENKRRSSPSIRFANCPKCLADNPTGVIRGADGAEVFRNHNKTLGKGRRIPCPGSGLEAPPPEDTREVRS